jgi:hypothetical protein
LPTTDAAATSNNTKRIIAEPRQKGYIKKVNAAGHRIGHYRERAVGISLVGFWDRGLGYVTPHVSPAARQAFHFTHRQK